MRWCSLASSCRQMAHRQVVKIERYCFFLPGISIAERYSKVLPSGAQEFP